MKAPFYIRKIRGQDLYSLFDTSQGGRAVCITGQMDHEWAKERLRSFCANWYRRQFRFVDGGIMYSPKRDNQPALRLVAS